MSRMIYAIQAVTGGPVKIGVAGEPLQRLAQLQGAHHEDLQIVRSFAGRTTSNSEMRLHSKLESFRLRGEWFSDVPELWDELDREEFDARSEEIALKTVDAIRRASENAVQEALANADPDGPTLDDITLAFHAVAESTYDELVQLFAAGRELAEEMLERGLTELVAA